MTNNTMKRIIFCFSFLLGLTTMILAQQNDATKFGCSYDELKEKGALTPEMVKKQAAFQKVYQQRMQQPNTASRQRPPVYTLPIVVHIFHGAAALGTQNNPTDAQVQAIIKETSQRFRHVHSEAKSYENPNYGIDTEIEFCLAATNPQGSSTTSIMRYSDNVNTGGEWFGVLSNLQSQYGWNPQNYINVFVVDGVNTCGGAITGNAIIATPDCFTSELMAHELGHYFSLAHTFQGGCTNNNCLTDGDGVCDTPPKASAGITGSCGGTDGNSCTTDDDDTNARNPYRPVSLGGMGDQPDMLENYMDYTGSCWNSFTRGQSDRMRLYIETSLSSLIASGNTQCSSVDSDGDTYSDAIDDCPDFDNRLIGTACDDNDANTTDDFWRSSCDCRGTYQDSDQDGVGDADDQCPGKGDYLIGLACDDNNPNTINDVYNNNCTCQGEPDADGDGLGDLTEDPCPGFNQNLIGTACNDNNPNTVDDEYQEDCSCLGYPDSDNDGVGDPNDQCPNFDNRIIGTPCNDNNSTTIDDVWQANCACAGTLCPSAPNAPVLTTSEANNSCPDDFVDLNSLFQGSVPSGVSLIWSTDNNPLNGISSTIPAVVSTNGVYYAYFFDSSNNCYSPASVGVNVTILNTNILTAPTIGNSSSIDLGATPPTLSVVTPASGSGTLGYQWQQSNTDCDKDFTDIPGATTTSYTPTIVNLNTYYRLVVSTSSNGQTCEQISNCVSITLNQIATQTICQGDIPKPLVMTQSSGVGNYTYQWQLSTENCNSTFIDIPGATELNYAPPAVSLTTYYRLVSSDLANGPDCEEISNCIEIIVTPALNLNITTNLLGTVCFREDVPITTNVSGGTGPYTYSWFPFTGLSDTTAANPLANPEFSTLYTLNVTDVNGCTAQDEIEIIVDVSTIDSDLDGLTDCEETTGKDNIDTQAAPPNDGDGPTSDPNDPCDPFGIGPDCGDCSISVPKVVFPSGNNNE